MNEHPYFSVILNTHNNENTIERTFNSLINQSYTNFEIIVVDDCSVDQTIEKIDKIKSTVRKTVDFVFIKLSTNRGISYARNIGIDEANGKYIAFLDGDDLWKKDKLLTQYQFINRTGAEWVFSNYSVVNNKYEYLGERVRTKGIYDYRKIISRGNPVGMLTVVVSSIILKSNHFRNIKHEDYDLWIRLARKGVPGFLMSDSLASYMKHRNSFSSNKIQSAKWTFEVFRANNINFLYCAWLTVKYIINYFCRKRDNI